MGRKKIHVYIATACLLAAAVLCCLFSLRMEDPWLAVEVTSGRRTERINLWAGEEGRYFLFLPGWAETEDMKLRTNAEGEFYLNGEAVSDKEICEGLETNVAYPLTDREGNSTGTVTLVRSGSVATMFLETRSGSMEYIHENKENAEPGSCRVYTESGALNYSGSAETLKGRGNASWWGSEKKPYSLELAGSADLLGMGSAKKWVLLANGTEPSQIRNKAVLDFADAAGLPFTPESRWVDLYLNGEYAGLYLLTERNEIHTQRVNIGTDGTFLISMELRSRLEEQGYSHIVTEAEQALRIHQNHLETEQLTDVVQSAENAILAEDGRDPVTGKHWTELIDLQSWAEKYLLEELFANGDACSISQFFYYDGEMLYAGPAWDYDATMLKLVPQTMYGNRFQACEGKPTPWFHALYQKELFLDTVKALYRDRFRPLLVQLTETGIDKYGQQIGKAVTTNALRWPGTDSDASREQAKRYMKERMEFLDSLWLEGEDYCMVFVEFGPGINGAYYAVKPGDSLPELPVYEDTAQTRYLGWRDMQTGEPFDVHQPIYEDAVICLKQEAIVSDSVPAEEKVDPEPLTLLRLAPVLALAAVFGAVVLADLGNNRPKKKRGCHDGKG